MSFITVLQMSTMSCVMKGRLAVHDSLTSIVLYTIYSKRGKNKHIQKTLLPVCVFTPFHSAEMKMLDSAHVNWVLFGDADE